MANRFPGDVKTILWMLPIALIVGCAVAAANYWLGWFPDMKW
jgi:hypothetical protein